MCVSLVAICVAQVYKVILGNRVVAKRILSHENGPKLGDDVIMGSTQVVLGFTYVAQKLIVKMVDESHYCRCGMIRRNCRLYTRHITEHFHKVPERRLEGFALLGSTYHLDAYSTASFNRALWHWMLMPTGSAVMCVGYVRMFTASAVFCPPTACGPTPSALTLSSISSSSA
jgi:hypothetical protein